MIGCFLYRLSTGDDFDHAAYSLNVTARTFSRGRRRRMSETTNSTPQASDKVLVVVLHGYTYSPRHMAGVVKVIGSRISNARFLEPKLPLNTFSMIDPVRIARLVIGFIDQEIAHRIAKDWEPFEEIILVGHSCGALLARKLYVLAGPESPE